MNPQQGSKLSPPNVETGSPTYDAREDVFSTVDKRVWGRLSSGEVFIHLYLCVRLMQPLQISRHGRRLGILD